MLTAEITYVLSTLEAFTASGEKMLLQKILNELTTVILDVTTLTLR